MIIWVLVQFSQLYVDILKDDDDKHKFLNNIENWGCILGKGMDNQMFD